MLNITNHFVSCKEAGQEQPLEKQRARSLKTWGLVKHLF